MPTADQAMEPRLLVGINLFPAFLAARDDRRNDAPVVVVVFVDESPAVDSLAAALASRLSRSFPEARVNRLPLATLLERPQELVADAVFIMQPLLDRELEPLLRHTRELGTFSFSPLVGDIERGVVGGIAVSDRIQPSVNMEALRAHSIRLKDFFLKVSERYEARRKK